MSSKVCILSTCNIMHMTMCSIYFDLLKEIGVDYDIIYYDRYDIEEENKAAAVFRFVRKKESNPSIFNKISNLLSFKKYAIDILNKEKYSFIVAWNEVTSFLFSRYLSKNMPHRYCLNIRDYNYNKNPLINYIQSKCIKKSSFSTISSERFALYLPKHNYLFFHSYNDDMLAGVTKSKTFKGENEPINIMFIGKVSYPKSLEYLVNSLGDDRRFNILLYGAGCKQFETTNFSNVRIIDAFPPTKTGSLLEDADIIFTLNKEKDLHCDLLIPIKLYYSVARNIPLIAFKTSYTYELASKYGFGVGVSLKDKKQLGDSIYDQYHQLSYKELSDGCERLKKDIKESHRLLRKEFLRALKECGLI